MAALIEIRPTTHQRVMDLVCATGVNVDDWSNFKGGESKAASNPRYCYEWAFIELEKSIVLNLWYEELKEDNGTISQSINFRKISKNKKPIWQKRALTVDVALQQAYRKSLPVRVIVCEGTRRTDNDPNTNASHVEKRLLDPEIWAVTYYDLENGDCVLTRGVVPERFVDQFTAEDAFPSSPQRRENVSNPFVRSPLVRKRVLLRSNGKCEWCGMPGFSMPNGQIYLETHHVIPLFEGGPDSIQNVVALCPNHHREAHHGEAREAMRQELQSLLKLCNGEFSFETIKKAKQPKV